MSNMNEFYTKNYGINLESYADKELLQINGEDAVTYMVKFADNFVGISKDISVRFNIALMTGFWGYGLRNLQTLSEPTTYTIEGESNSITIPLFALPLINVSSSEHFSSICFGPSPSRTQVHEAKNYLKTFIPAPEVPPVNNSTTIETILEGDNINFYIMNGTTAVIEIPSFEPNDTSVFLKQMKQGFHTCVSRFVKNYIIDLTGNGGGDIELGYEFIQYLFPLFNPLNLYDMKQNPLGDQLATNAATSRNSSDWSYQAYMSNQYKPFSDETWYTHGNTWTRGGVTGNYSQQFYFNFGPLEAQEHKKTQKFTRLTPVNSILILSKGFCGSTCAVTSRHLHEFDGVYTVSACGLQNTQLSFSSFPGGQVYALDDLVADLETYHLESSPLAPQSLPTSATFSFAIKEIYGPDLTIPAEFVVDFADFRLDCTPTSANYQRELWIDAVQFFDEIET